MTVICGKKSWRIQCPIFDQLGVSWTQHLDRKADRTGRDAVGVSHDSPRASRPSKNTTKIPRKDPREKGRKNENFLERGTKRAKFWAVRRRRVLRRVQRRAGEGGGPGEGLEKKQIPMAQTKQPLVRRGELNENQTGSVSLWCPLSPLVPGEGGVGLKGMFSWKAL